MPSDLQNLREKPVILIHHAANCNHNEPPGSILALRQCLSAKASVVEIDVIPLADGSFALLHDPDLEADTNGMGYAPRMNREQIKNLVYVRDGIKTGEKVGFLEDAISLFEKYMETRRLQLDLKPFSPLPVSVLRNLLSIIERVIDRVQVTSYADWVVRGLSRLSPDLSLGFDPLSYLDIREDQTRPENTPPFRLGAYGLLDDHPLSAYQWGPPGDYFAARAESLLAQVPEGCEWFIRVEILKMALDAGFDWIDFLHRQGSKVDGWTIDVTQTAQLELAQVLVDHKIDDLTTDHPAILATFLKVETIL